MQYSSASHRTAGRCWWRPWTWPRRRSPRLPWTASCRPRPPASAPSVPCRPRYRSRWDIRSFCWQDRAAVSAIWSAVFTVTFNSTYWLTFLRGISKFYFLNHQLEPRLFLSPFLMSLSSSNPTTRSPGVLRYSHTKVLHSLLDMSLFSTLTLLWLKEMRLLIFAQAWMITSSRSMHLRMYLR